MYFISHLIKRTASPAKSLFVLTKTLQPVVSRCLFGWPEMTMLKVRIMIYSSVYMIRKRNSKSKMIKKLWKTRKIGVEEGAFEKYGMFEVNGNRRRMILRRQYRDKYVWMSMHYHANLLLPAPVLGVASKNPTKEISFSYYKEFLSWMYFTLSCDMLILNRNFQFVRTRGGKIFSAARRGTEKPPWVLVSLAVRVLQKNSEGCLLCLRPMSDASIASLSYCRKHKFKQHRLWVFIIYK